MSPTQMPQKCLSSSTAADDASRTFTRAWSATRDDPHLVPLAHVYEGLRREGERLGLEAGGPRRKTAGLGVWLPPKSFRSAPCCCSCCPSSSLVPEEGIVLLVYFKGKRWSTIGTYTAHCVPFKSRRSHSFSKGPERHASPGSSSRSSRYSTLPLLILTVEEALYCMSEYSGPSSVRSSLIIFDSLTARRVTLSDLLSLLCPPFLPALECSGTLHEVWTTGWKRSRQSSHRGKAHGQDESTRGRKEAGQAPTSAAQSFLPSKLSTDADSPTALSSRENETLGDFACLQFRVHGALRQQEHSPENCCSSLRQACFTCLKEASPSRPAGAADEPTEEKPTPVERTRYNRNANSSSSSTAWCSSSCVSSSPACSAGWAGCRCRPVSNCLCPPPRLSFQELFVYLILRKSGLRLRRRGIGALAAAIRLCPVFVSSRLMKPCLLFHPPPTVQPLCSCALDCLAASPLRSLMTMRGSPFVQTGAESRLDTPGCGEAVGELDEVEAATLGTRDGSRRFTEERSGAHKEYQTAGEGGRGERDEEFEQSTCEQGASDKKGGSSKGVETDKRADCKNQSNALGQVCPAPRWIISCPGCLRQMTTAEPWNGLACSSTQDIAPRQAKAASRQGDAGTVTELRQENLKNEAASSRCGADVKEEWRISWGTSGSGGSSSKGDGTGRRDDRRPEVDCTDNGGKRAESQKEPRPVHGSNMHPGRDPAPQNPMAGPGSQGLGKVGAQTGVKTDVLPVFPVLSEESAPSLLSSYFGRITQPSANIFAFSCCSTRSAPFLNSLPRRGLPPSGASSRVCSSVRPRRRLHFHTDYPPPDHRPYCCGYGRGQEQGQKPEDEEAKQRETEEELASRRDETDKELCKKTRRTASETSPSSIVVGAASPDGAVALVQARAVAVL